MAISPQHARTALTAMRLTVGLTSILTPRTSGRILGMDPDVNREVLLLGRLFGVRNTAMGLDLLGHGPSEPWRRYGVAIDLVDAAALLGGGLRGYLSRRTVTTGTALALTAAALSAAVASDD